MKRLLTRHRLDARGDEDPELHGHACLITQAELNFILGWPDFDT